MKMEKSNSGFMKFISVVLGALVGGFMWRCRGESGFGSSWGLYSVGLMLILLIYHFYGRRKGMKYEMIPLGAFLTGLGVTGYATVIEQLSGYIDSFVPFGGQENALGQVDPKSGLIIILIMGFTLIPFFSFFVFSLFSDKEYKIYHYAIAAVIFFIVSLVAKLTVAPLIVNAINPDQVEWAARGLKEYGFDYASPMQAYLKNFGDRDWADDIAFFENYYMSVEHVADAFGVIAISIYALTAMKDKITAFLSLALDILTSISTTALSLMIAAPYESGFLNGVACTRTLQNGSGWGLWEFSTGAAIGLFTMLLIAFLPKKYTAQSKPDNSTLTNNKGINFAIDLVLTVFIFGVVPFRVIGIRINKLIHNLGFIEEGSTYGEIACIVAAVIFGIWLIKVFKKNILVLNDTAFRINPCEFAATAFPAYLAMCGVAYFFLNHACIVTLPYSKMTSLSAALFELTSPESIATFVMFITFVLITAIYIPTKRKLMK